VWLLVVSHSAIGPGTSLRLVPSLRKEADPSVERWRPGSQIGRSAGVHLPVWPPILRLQAAVLLVSATISPLASETLRDSFMIFLSASCVVGEQADTQTQEGQFR
jgi:hypothetical protein